MIEEKLQAEGLSESLPKRILASLRQSRQRRIISPAAVAGPVCDLTVASYNVHKCVGRDRRFDPGRTAEVIREIDADVIALQEADTRFGERTGLLDLGWLERETGLTRVPLSVSERAHGFHGNTLLFREGLVRDLNTVRLPGLEPRGALVAELELKDSRELRIIAAHFGLLRHSRRQQANHILDIVRNGGEYPTLLVGDLNEWRLGKGSALRALAPVFDASVAVPSFPAGLPVLALDRILSNRPDLIRSVEVHDSPLARVASDHLPIKAFLHFS
ncbi:endonuclease/exonuclease/phosphatase family protein [Rhizobiaceae bacterium BDR2-2]|uniref:Endonuclease/exonuclease/phosphatase family protein n=1 Tax=Ectorhizobium quercum TaxID=2965071 RepID=A0AAE3MYK4_9HYPH|nr:endonuclease/exonuclease/phosphatase family protein [Ectorhizobium quercum]MCX8996449.1 endonuclease/exonuclease/phosphatase family protein [Ectorhizobium quercum]